MCSPLSRSFESSPVQLSNGERDRSEQVEDYYGPGLEAAMFFLLIFHLSGCGHLETPDHRGGRGVQSSCVPRSHPISAYRFGHLHPDCGVSVSECLRFHVVEGTKEVALTLELLWKKDFNPPDIQSPQCFCESPGITPLSTREESPQVLLLDLLMEAPGT